jgi:SpoU rRNA methylase family enzyme
MKLGESYDLSTGLAPVDMSTAANTGKRLFMQEVNSVDIVLIKAAGTAADDPVLTLKQHTASTGGTTTDLAVITSYNLKNEATLDGDETWTTVTQAAAATITDPGGAGTSAESQQIVVIHVRADQLTPGNAYISLDIADVGAAAQLGTVLYIVHTADHVAPASLLAPLR